MQTSWPPRFRLPRSTSGALASVCAEWNLTELADGQSQQRALVQVCSKVPQLRPSLDAVSRKLRQECAVIIQDAPTTDTALVIAASAMGVVTEDHEPGLSGSLVPGLPGWLVYHIGPAITAPANQPTNLPSAQRHDALPFHTDSPYSDDPPRVVVLACVEPDRDSGGLSLFIPVDRIISEMKADGREREVRLLQDPCFPFAIELEGDRPRVHIRHILRLVDGDIFVRYHAKRLQVGSQLAPESLDVEHKTALEVFQAVLHRPSLPTSFLLQANDLLIFDNLRVLHGRTEMSLRSNRHIKKLKVSEFRSVP
ncbi:MAG: TauD/TfdA family dioxygenase [Pseudonocardiaceae bacterium]